MSFVYILRYFYTCFLNDLRYFSKIISLLILILLSYANLYLWQFGMLMQTRNLMIKLETNLDFSRVFRLTSNFDWAKTSLRFSYYFNFKYRNILFLTALRTNLNSYLKQLLFDRFINILMLLLCINLLS